MPAAVALNSVAINVSRAIGPAIAGVLVAAVGAVARVPAERAVVLRHHRGAVAMAARAPQERAAGRALPERHSRRHALRHAYPRVAGRAHSRHAPFSCSPARPGRCFRSSCGASSAAVRRSTASCSHASASARVAGAVLLPRLRAKFSRDALVAGASVLYALAALALAYVQNIALLAVAMLATGVAWISILSALQVSAQMTLPAWVRARGLAAFVVVFMGGMALGSILWGQVATRIGIPAALTTAAVGMVVAIAATWRFKLGTARSARFHAVDGLAAPVLAETPGTGQRPVMVTIEYRDPARQARRIRRGDAGRARNAPAQRRVFLGAVPRLGRIPRATSNVSWTSRGSSTCASTSA